MYFFILESPFTGLYHIINLITRQFIRIGVLEEFNKRVFDLGIEYNHALAAIENNNMGIASNIFFKNKD